MKKLILLVSLLCFAVFTFGQTNTKTVTVKGYTKKDGTIVQSYTKTVPNKTNTDNYSTSGNTNTYTGTKGYKPKDYSTAAYSYTSTKTIYTGPKGGQYYINSKGNKTYVPKTK